MRLCRRACAPRAAPDRFASRSESPPLSPRKNHLGAINQILSEHVHQMRGELKSTGARRHHHRCNAQLPRSRRPQCAIEMPAQQIGVVVAGDQRFVAQDVLGRSLQLTGPRQYRIEVRRDVGLAAGTSSRDCLQQLLRRIPACGITNSLRGQRIGRMITMQRFDQRYFGKPARFGSRGARSGNSSLNDTHAASHALGDHWRQYGMMIQAPALDHDFRRGVGVETRGCGFRNPESAVFSVWRCRARHIARRYPDWGDEKRFK